MYAIMVVFKHTLLYIIYDSTQNTALPDQMAPNVPSTMYFKSYCIVGIA